MEIAALDYGFVAQPLTVRAYRVWIGQHPGNKDALGSFEAALVDEEHSVVHATAHKRDAKRLFECIEEGGLYRIWHFTVSTKPKNYKGVPNSKIVHLGSGTVIKPVLNLSTAITVPKRMCFFVDYGDLHNRADVNSVLTDLIGFITAAGAMDKVDISGRICEKRDVEIENERGDRITIVLWEDYGRQFDTDHWIEVSKSQHVVGIFLGLTIKKSKWIHGSIHVGTSNASRYYIEDGSEEIASFHSKLRSPPETITKMESSNHTVISVEEQKTSNRRTIQELLSNLNTEDHEKYTCIAKITGINTSRPWYFKGCPTCRASSVNITEGGQCNNCSQQDKSPVYYYKLNTLVEDDTASTHFLLFGIQAEIYLKTPCQAFAGSIDSNATGLPITLQGIIGRTQNFQICTDYNAARNISPFVITRIFDCGLPTDQLLKQPNIVPSTEPNGPAASKLDQEKPSTIGNAKEESSDEDDEAPLVFHRKGKKRAASSAICSSKGKRTFKLFD